MGRRVFLPPRLRSLQFLLASDAEVTTTSTGPDTTLKTLSGFSVPVTDMLFLYLQYRKSGGAAASFRIGLQVNATQVMVAASNAITSTTDRIEIGTGWIIVGPQTTSYLSAIGGWTTNSVGAGLVWPNTLANLPNAVITQLVLTGEVGSASITGGIANVKLYRMPVI